MSNATFPQDRPEEPQLPADLAPALKKAAPLPKFPHSLPSQLRLVVGQDGCTYAIPQVGPSPIALQIGSRGLQQVIRDAAAEEHVLLRKADLADIEGLLEAHASTYGEKAQVWYRVAPCDGGVELDLGDTGGTRFRVTAAGIQRVEHSTTIFQRTALMKPMVAPALKGDLSRLNRYVNMNAADLSLLKAWLAYTLSQPKTPESKYVILLLSGHQGSGKSFLCKIIQRLLDPCVVGVQMLPTNPRDLAVAARNTHVLFYDNVRSIQPFMSDALCVLATGGSLTSRRLYTDAEQQVLHLHGALVLNGLSNFLDQPDLAQRSLHLPMALMPEDRRRSERAMGEQLEEDLPVIMAGLLELVAGILRHLPEANVTKPQRMYEFVRYLAAMEAMEGLPVCAYQDAYEGAINEGQRDALMDSVVGSAILEFAQEQGEWSGSPTELLAALNTKFMWTLGVPRPRQWPDNAIALSKRLIPMAAALRSQGIRVEFARGKERTITITKIGAC